MAEGSSQTAGGQVLETTQTTTEPQAPVEPPPAMAEARRPREAPEQPAT
jgi:hypothetical protein